MKGIVSVLVLLLLSTVFAGAPDTLWTRTYGGAGDDVGRSMQLTADGGCIIAGWTRSFGAGGADVWLLKTDSLGETLWARTYGGSLDDGAYSVDLAFDGGYVVAGMTKSFGAGGADVWLLKIAASGDTEWTRTFGDTLADSALSVQQTTDGGYIIAGDARSPTPPYYPTEVCLIKTDSRGDTTWTRSYGPGTHPRVVLHTPDGGYTVAARLVVGGTEYAWLMKTDSLGDTLWTRTSGSVGLNDIQFRPEGGYVLTGVVGPAPSIFWAGCMDTLGHELWGRFYADGTGRSIRPVGGGGYIATGNASVGRSDVYLVRVDSLGDSLWSKVVGGDFEDIGYAGQQTSDSGFLVLGSTRSFGAGRADVWLIRFEAEQVGIKEAREAEVRAPDCGPTFLRGALVLGGVDSRQHSARRAELVDISGRTVMTLRPGPNDVRALASGVYFVREALGAECQTSGIRKVVLTY